MAEENPYRKNKMKVVFEVTTNFDITVDEATVALLQAEVALNSVSSLRWHLTEVTLKDVKSFVQQT